MDLSHADHQFAKQREKSKNILGRKMTKADGWESRK